MNKIEQMHFEAITEAEFSNYSGHSEGQKVAAIKSAEITEQVAVEFAEWLGNAEFLKLKSGNWTNNFGISEYSGKILFQEFIKTKQ
jgi:hypothetical protein